MSFIYFNYNKNLIYAFIYWLLEIIARILIYFQRDLFQIFKKDSVNEYYFAILRNISDFFSIFLVIYIKCSLKEKHINDDFKINLNNSKLELIAGEKPMAFHVTKKFISEMILICILDYLNRLALFNFYQLNPDANHDIISHKFQFDITNNIDIIFRLILSIFVFKTKVYKHHIISIFIIIIGFIILIPSDVLSLHFFPGGINEKFTYIYVGIVSCKGFLYPTEDTIQKKIFTENYIIPELFFLFRGLGDLILFIVITPILYFSLWIKDDESFDLASSLPSIVILSIVYCIFSFIKELIVLKVLYYFFVQSVSFLLISESLTGTISEIVRFFDSKKNKSENYNIIFLTIDIIIIFLTAFATFIYNEIIVIRKCGLDLYVSSEITSRALSEIKKINMTINDDDEIDEDYENEEGDNKTVELEKK